ncbi:unnamed protein product [Calicophoron daubneyi]|uniref:THO complex subunit 2 n=1 Tax=Calicophoron daubneyi TaxID=300641 RepID=A0AAV2TE49_CALDB
MEQILGICQNPIFINSCLKEWEKYGKKNFLQKCKEVGSRDTVRLLLDLFVRLLNGDGKVDILGKLLPEVLKQVHDAAGFESQLLDILWLIDINSDTVRDRYFRILHFCRNYVNSGLLMERLSEDTLENLSLIQSKQQFQTRYVRTKTRLFFKQQKFNLLREEDEGYAKLITELCQAVGPMEPVMMQVRSLIGYFDLDPNRVLDLILDVCEFRENMSLSMVKLVRLYNPDKLDLTHILGHKFHFTQEPDSTTPRSLYRIAAILVASGLVNLDVLYTHLCPSDADIQNALSHIMSSAKSYRPVAPSSLALANSTALNTSLNSVINSDLCRGDTSLGGGLLQNPLFPTITAQDQPIHGSGSVGGWISNGTLRSSDDDVNLTDDAQPVDSIVPPAGDSSEDREREASADYLYENNQKLELCAAMIRLGDWNSAQSLLDRFPGYWATGHRSLNKALCDLLHSLIEPLYSQTCPLPPCMQKTRYRHPNVPSEMSSLMSSDDGQCTSLSPNNPNSSSSSPLEPVDDFAKLARVVLPVATYLGANMSADVVLMVKFCRLGCAYLSNRPSRGEVIEPVYQGFFNILDEVLLPSLSLVDANCCLAEEIWQLLRLLPYDHRYRLYGQWKHMSGRNEPKIIRKQAEVLVRAKAIMKRLSKGNIKPMGRQLGKLSHSNPGLLFDLVLSTVQLYTNLIGPVVEALKYVSSLGYDILTFCIIEALSSDDSKLEDLQLSQGLQALSTFTGLLCKKYQFDLSGLLQYVLNQLKVGKSYDLQILREILHRMSGIDISEEMTDEQLESMSGGEVLLQEGGYYAQIRNTRKNATRLKDSLIEHKLIMPFVFLMAQQRDAVLFLDDPDRHVKLAGRLYDQCQGTLVQFITFLSLQLTREEMQTQCLPIERMMGEFHVPADTAFCLYRSLFEQKVARLFETKERVEAQKSGEKSKLASKALFAAVSQQICGEIAAAIRPLYPVRVWDELGTSFFVTFWSLQSSDLVVPEAAYQRQIQQLREQIQNIETAPTGWTSAKKKREVERLQGLIEKLGTEQVERLEHVARVRAWLLAERDTWFQTRLVTKTDTITQFLQLCIYPRVCFTAADAVYAAQFIHVLHQLKTSRFSTLICLDRIFNDITLPTSMCTEDEAHRYGRFLCAVLELVMRWHASEETFNQECGQYPGFVTVFRKGSDANNKADQLQYENYRHVVHKWHYRITKATVACLESGSYVQIRNALIVLTRILPQYPRITQFGSAVKRRVIKLKEEEKDKRPDLKALAFSYAGLMRPRESKWVNEEDFHLKENKPSRNDSVSSLGGSSVGMRSSSAFNDCSTLNMSAVDGSQHGGRMTLNHTNSAHAMGGGQSPSGAEALHGPSSTRRQIANTVSVPNSKLASTVTDSRPRSHVMDQPAPPPSGTSELNVSKTVAVAVSGSSQNQSGITKQRSVQRIESNSSAPADQTHSVEGGQSSKRKRVEPPANLSTNSSSVSSPTSVKVSSSTSSSSPLSIWSVDSVVSS